MNGSSVRSFFRHPPWWMLAAMAVFVGFGSAQDSARQLGDASGWGLVGHWTRIVFGIVAMFFWGWLALQEFRSREVGTG